MRVEWTFQEHKWSTNESNDLSCNLMCLKIRVENMCTKLYTVECQTETYSE